MHRQIEKLDWIVESLSKMVKLEQNIDEFEVTGTKIRQTILDAVDTVYEKLEKKEISLRMEPFEDRLLYHNRRWTAEVFVNLLENAVKYNHENGWVRVTLDADHKFFYVKVSDSGIGIPEESIDYIFERFYRVDKSHSREIGGTGLGLAITRSAVVAHRGAIRVQSSLEEGTVFTVRIPIRYIA